MIIANPIYDVVFKALLEDPKIAKGFLSALIGMEILEIRLVSKEHVRKDQGSGDLLALRLDFCAVVKTADGRTIQVIIELQKAKIGTNPLRFRHYLASRYMSSEEICENGESRIKTYPIISVYLLGYYLDRTLPVAIRVKRDYYNAVTGHPIENAKPNDFIEKLSHDSIFVQIPKIKGEMGTQLERVLSIFNQRNKLNEDDHRLEIDEKRVKANPLLKKIYRTLNRLQESPEMEKIMTLEDISLIEQQEGAAEAKEELKLERERREEEQRRREEEQRRREDAERRREDAEKEVARLRKLLEESKKPSKED